MRPYLLKHPGGLVLVASFTVLDAVYRSVFRSQVHRAMGI
jgi:hypothetical protein